MSMQLPLVLVIVLIPIGVAFLMYAVYQDMTDVAKSMRLNSKAYDAYVNPPVPSYQSIYVFNLTNYEDVLNGELPVVVELGPYVFRILTHRKVAWHGELAEITETKTYHFDPSLSNGSLDDTIFTINIYVITLLDMFQERPDLTHMLKNRTLFFSVKVGKLLYEGYKDDLESTNILWFPEGRISYLRPDNGSSTKYKIYTGRRKRSNDTNAYYSWQNNKSLAYFGTDCDRLEGTNGEFYEPTLHPPPSVKLFRPSLCKPWTLYDMDRFLYLREPIVRYGGSTDLYNETGNPVVDRCFSPNATHIVGTFDATRCYMKDHKLTTYTSQTILSSPHFLNGDQRLVENISGLMPDPYQHDFYLDIHAKTGFVVDMRRRVQYNFKLLPTPVESGLPPVIYPVFWEQIWRLPKDRDKLLIGLVHIGFPVGWLAVTAALFFSLAIMNVITALVIFAKNIRAESQLVSGPKGPRVLPKRQSPSQALPSGAAERSMKQDKPSSANGAGDRKPTTKPPKSDSSEADASSEDAAASFEKSISRTLVTDDPSLAKQEATEEDEATPLKADSSEGTPPVIVEPKSILRSRPAGMPLRSKPLGTPKPYGQSLNPPQPYPPPGYPAPGYPPPGYPQTTRPAKGLPQATGPAQGYPQTASAAQRHPATSPAQGYPQTAGSAPGYPQTAGPAQGYPQQGYPQAAGQAPRYPQTAGQAPGYPQTAGQAPGYPQTAGQAPGYPQTAGQAPGYPQTAGQAPGYPQTAGQAPGYPQTAGQAPGYPQAAGQAPRYPQSAGQAPGYPQAANQAPGYPYPANPPPRYPQTANPAPGYPQSTAPAPGYPAPAYPQSTQQAPGYPSPAYPTQTYPAPANQAPAYPTQRAGSQTAASVPARDETDGTRPTR